MGQIKHELVLEGLSCANCAAKIEDKVAKLNGVNFASVNFVTKTLNMELSNSDIISKVLNQVKDIVKQIEPQVIIQEKAIQKSVKQVLVLLGLECANCSAKIEREIGNLPGVRQVELNFATGKLSMQIDSKHNRDWIVEESIKIIARFEPGVKVEVEEQERAKAAPIPEVNRLELVRTAAGALLFFVALLVDLPGNMSILLYLLSYFLVGGEVLFNAVRNLTRGQVFDENFLMTIATVGAIAIGEYPEGVAVMLFYQIGEFFQDLAVNRSRKSITSLMDLRPDYANLKSGTEIKKVSPEEVAVGDTIVVKPGEKIPLDGKVSEGISFVDTSALTGEAVPREVQRGSEVLGGFINSTGLIEVVVAKEFSESTVAKILDLVENAAGKKAPTENFITKFARYYTPAVVYIAAALAIIPPLFVPGAAFADWFYRALIFLVISCPCALVVSIPLGFFGGIGGASRHGILVKGGNYLEALNAVDTVVFDKTGTLTKGVFNVTKISPAEGMTEELLLQAAALAESYSNHPIAASILKAYNKEIDQSIIENYQERPGYGLKVTVDGSEVLAGNHKLMEAEGISYFGQEVAGTVVYVAIDRKYAGFIVISDEVKEDSARTIKGLKELGIKKTIILTGDNKQVGFQVAKELDVDEVYAELLPHEKVEKLELLVQNKGSKGKLAFVGDGINDAPVLARADVGIAMGGLGSDAAIEAADIVIMTDEPAKIVRAITTAKRTRSIVWQNIVFALGVKGVVLLLGAGGLATMWEAVFADVGVALIAVLNSMRAMR